MQTYNSSLNGESGIPKAVQPLNSAFPDISPITIWRWRRKGFLDTVNICGRQYVTPAALLKFRARAEAGEFAQEHKAPGRTKSAQPAVAQPGGEA